MDVGCNGRISDGGVFARSSLSGALESGSLSIPNPSCLPGTTDVVPYVLVADDAFPLTRQIMKPYPFRNQSAPNRIFNYRLSRARRVVENSFGLLSQVFRIFRKPLLLGPEKAEAIVLAACALHNFLLTKSPKVYAPVGVLDTENEDGSFVNGSWRDLEPSSNSFIPLAAGSRSFSADARKIRENLRDYFLSPDGEIPWQYRYI